MSSSNYLVLHVMQMVDTAIMSVLKRQNIRLIDWVSFVTEMHYDTITLNYDPVIMLSITHDDIVAYIAQCLKRPKRYHSVYIEKSTTRCCNPITQNTVPSIVIVLKIQCCYSRATFL